jgi:excisionase family DNA binding protein
MSCPIFWRMSYLKPKSSNKLPAAYLTPGEASEVLRVDRRTIYEWLRSGKLKAVRFGRTWRIKRSSVTKPVEQERDPSTTA